MKKQLLTTTALVTAGVIAVGATPAMAKPKLKLAGWMEGIIGYVDQDIESVALDPQWDSEIHFKFSEKLDNGMKVTGRVELEGAQAGDQVDEAYLQVAGSWGAIRVGSEDNAAFLMATGFSGSWATGVGQNLNFDVQDFIRAPGNFSANRVGRLNLGVGDSEKINYFTPKVGGFQAAVSYDSNAGEDTNNPTAGAGTAGGGIGNGWAFGGRYSGKFDNVGFGVAAGYTTYLDDNTAGADFDPKGYHVSGKVKIGAVTLAAGYLSEMNRQADTAATSRDRRNLDLGAKFDAGKNKFSIGYLTSESEGARATTGDDKTTQVMVSYRRELGPGVQYRLNVMFADFAGEVAGSADDNEGYAVSTSVRVGF